MGGNVDRKARRAAEREAAKEVGKITRAFWATPAAGRGCEACQACAGVVACAWSEGRLRPQDNPRDSGVAVYGFPMQIPGVFAARMAESGEAAWDSGREHPIVEALMRLSAVVVVDAEGMIQGVRSTKLGLPKLILGEIERRSIRRLAMLATRPQDP